MKQMRVTTEVQLPSFQISPNSDLCKEKKKKKSLWYTTKCPCQDQTLAYSWKFALKLRVFREKVSLSPQGRGNVHPQNLICGIMLGMLLSWKIDNLYKANIMEI